MWDHGKNEEERERLSRCGKIYGEDFEEEGKRNRVKQSYWKGISIEY